MSNEVGKRSIKDILNDMHARGGEFADFANELTEAVNREFAEFASELKSEFLFWLRNNVKQEEKQMDSPETYTFTREQLRVVIEDAVDLRDHEVAMNPILGKPVRTPAVFADEYAKTLGSTFNKNEKEDVWARRAKEDAELSNDQDEDAQLAAEAEKKETEDEKEPKVEGEEDEPKGYISSRPVDKLQFNIDTVKLANLPGLFNTLKSEGVFFKQIANRWNAGEVDECGLDRLGDGDGTVSENLADLHYCTDSFWVNPKYANKKVSSLGGIGSRVIAEDGKTSVCLWVYYLEKDGTVIAWDMDVD